MNNFTTTATTTGSLTKDGLLDSIKAIAELKPNYPSTIEAFAQVLEKCHPDSAERVRKQGMPVCIIAGDNSYDILYKCLSPYCKVIKQPEYIMDPDNIFLSWMKVDLCFKIDLDDKQE